ncbi:MAG: hypothetical protein ACLU2C_05200 [Lachnospiraceae bacterium]
MYILIELVAEVDGSGLVFVCILLIVLALVFGAYISMTWMLAPLALTMALLKTAYWWILLLLAGIGIIANWVSAKHARKIWNPELTLSMACASAMILVAIAMIDAIVHAINNHPQMSVLEGILMVVLGIPILAFFLYPIFSTLMALTAVTTIPCGYKPFVGAICSAGSVAASAIALQGLVEGVAKLFGGTADAVLLNLDALETFFSGMPDMSSVTERLQSIVDAIASVPVWFRFFTALAVAIGCIFGEKHCADGRTLFS